MPLKSGKSREIIEDNINTRFPDINVLQIIEQRIEGDILVNLYKIIY
jgi:hypothetical protein